MAEENETKVTNSAINSSSSSSSNVVGSINGVFGSVPTQAEAQDSITAFQSFMNSEGRNMLVQNPEFQLVEIAFQFMRRPMVQEIVKSVMCDLGVITAILKNETFQVFLRSLMLANSTMRLTNGANIEEPAVQGSNSMEHGLVSTILSWLLDTMESGFLGIFGSLRSLVNQAFESSQTENTKSSSDSGQVIHLILLLTKSSSDSGQVIHLILLLAIIILLIVFVRRTYAKQI